MSSTTFTYGRRESETKYIFAHRLSDEITRHFCLTRVGGHVGRLYPCDEGGGEIDIPWDGYACLIFDDEMRRFKPTHVLSGSYFVSSSDTLKLVHGDDLVILLKPLTKQFVSCGPACTAVDRAMWAPKAAEAARKRAQVARAEMIKDGADVEMWRRFAGAEDAKARQMERATARQKKPRKERTAMAERSEKKEEETEEFV